ncbi:hypothetical protein M514_00943 [Trichuris suis]|uniref:Uncharacterized protein n=1 Tax=Trichuris suis TaxID=68888 RepID=A0A085MLT4_9BILA|nr:hypothetical protein M513_00943 [Trichuris suis]KFD70442.1 hypothetical protein M514_00943 [Trichuris suis]
MEPASGSYSLQHCCRNLVSNMSNLVIMFEHISTWANNSYYEMPQNDAKGFAERSLKTSARRPHCYVEDNKAVKKLSRRVGPHILSSTRIAAASLKIGRRNGQWLYSLRMMTTKKPLSWPSFQNDLVPSLFLLQVQTLRQWPLESSQNTCPVYDALIHRTTP